MLFIFIHSLGEVKSLQLFYIKTDAPHTQISANCDRGMLTLAAAVIPRIIL